MKQHEPIIFLECTTTWRDDVGTGIQRVVRNILRNAGPVAAGRGYAAVPVALQRGQYAPVDLGRFAPAGSSAPAEAAPCPDRSSPLQLLKPLLRAFKRLLFIVIPSGDLHYFLDAPSFTFGLRWLLQAPRRAADALRLRGVLWGRRLGMLDRAAAGQEDITRCDLDQYASHAGNILLLLDASWVTLPWPAVRRFQRRGGKVVCVVYDLIPLTHPETCCRALRVAFRRWAFIMLGRVDAIVGISHSVEVQLRDLAEQGAFAERRSRPLGFSFFHFGNELDRIDGGATVHDGVLDIYRDDSHVFLVVGSLEPRKNLPFILDAFDLFWNSGGTGRLVVIGKVGWMNEALLARIAGHPQLGAQLFLLRDATDVDLDHAYRQSSALIFASMVEGFGLPIVEAFGRGLPVLCSDIPVFREIADGRATFFDLADPAALAEAVAAFCARYPSRADVVRTVQPWLTWRQSTQQLLGEVVRLVG